MTSTLAVFDLDSTLIEGDCELVWCDLLFRFGWVNSAFMAKLKIYCVEYEIGWIDFAKYERFILSPVARKSPLLVQQMLDEYLKMIRTLIRPKMQTVLDGHFSRGDTVLLATASNSFLAEPIAALLGISNVVCTQCQIVNGVPTGNVPNNTAFREGKVEGVKAWIKDHQTSLVGSWGYSDSHNDLPILSLVENAVAVTPDVKLRRVARRKGWQILDARV